MGVEIGAPQCGGVISATYPTGQRGNEFGDLPGAGFPPQLLMKGTKMLSNNLRDRKESRGKNIAEMNTIHGKADGGSRDLSGEERVFLPSI